MKPFLLWLRSISDAVKSPKTSVTLSVTGPSHVVGSVLHMELTRGEIEEVATIIERGITAPVAVAGKQPGTGYVRQENGTDDSYYHAGGLDPWTFEKAMQSTGNAFIDSRRSDVIEYVFRLKGGGLDRDAMLKKLREDATKARDNAQAIVTHIDELLKNL